MARHSSSAEQAHTLAVALEEEFGVPFTLYDAASGTMISLDPEPGQPQNHEPVSVGPSAVSILAREGRAHLTPLPDHRYRLALPLYIQRKPIFVAVSEMRSS